MEQKTNISPLAWFLLAGTFLSRVALFLTLPFLAVYISKKFMTMPETTGFILGLGPLSGIVCAFLMGYASDLWERKIILCFSLLIWSLAFFGYGLAASLWQIALFHMIYGGARASFESVASALLSDATPIHLRQKVFHLRYYAINLGACIGPVLGGWLLLRQNMHGFWITAIVYLLYCLALSIYAILKPLHFPKKSHTKSVRFGTTIMTLRQDKVLFLFILTNILVMIGFAQFETTLPQFLEQGFGDWGTKWFVRISIVNAWTIVLFQFPLAKWTKKYELENLLKIGFFLFGVGITSFALFTNHIPWMMLSMFIFTFGEMLVFSNSQVWIDRHSPSHLKGSYFGTLELRTLGLVIGPFVGGLLLEKTNASMMFFCLGLLSFAGIFLLKTTKNK